jgi:hypothetical protein
MYSIFICEDRIMKPIEIVLGMGEEEERQRG